MAINWLMLFSLFAISDLWHVARQKMTTICPVYSIFENKSENAYVLKFWMTILVPGWSRVDFFLRNRHKINYFYVFAVYDVLPGDKWLKTWHWYHLPGQKLKNAWHREYCENWSRVWKAWQCISIEFEKNVNKKWKQIVICIYKKCL